MPYTDGKTLAALMSDPPSKSADDEVINTDSDNRNKALEVLSEFLNERVHQSRKWADGTFASLDAHDDKHYKMPSSWIVWITHYSSFWAKTMVSPMGHGHAMLFAFRRGMIQVGALALAAILWVDRQIGIDQ